MFWACCLQNCSCELGVVSFVIYKECHGIKKLQLVIKTDERTLLESNNCDKPKRFYRNVSITQSASGGYEINLDKRKLRTPLGTVFAVPNEPLAVAVATEWDAQKERIAREQMHMTQLCNTVIDNPTRRSREQIANHVLEFLCTDTICYRHDEPLELQRFLCDHWNPLLNWFCTRYGVEIEPTMGLHELVIPEKTTVVLNRHLLTYNDWSLVGIQHAVETLKSLILALAVIDKHLSVETAVYLSRLELEFQITKWGKVEWAHEVDKTEVQARVAAAVLFVHLCSECFLTRKKTGVS